MRQIYGACNGYEIGEEIYSTLISKIRLAYKDNQTYIFKYTEKENIDFKMLLDFFKHEVNSLSTIKHNHIVKMIDSSYDAEMTLNNKNNECNTIHVMYILVEYLTGGSLFDIVLKTGKFSEKVARYYFKQLISAINYIHYKGFIHRDLKLENIILDKEYNLKIIDFGMSVSNKENHEEIMKLGIVGTPGYIAPEMCSRETFIGEELDVFAAGVVLFIMLSQSYPFSRATFSDQIYRYMYQEYPSEFWKCHEKSFDNFFSEDAKSLIQQMIAADPNDRLKMTEVLNHPWLTIPSASEEEIKKELKLRNDLINLNININKK